MALAVAACHAPEPAPVAPPGNQAAPRTLVPTHAKVEWTFDVYGHIGLVTTDLPALGQGGDSVVIAEPDRDGKGLTLVEIGRDDVERARFVVATHADYVTWTTTDVDPAQRALPAANRWLAEHAASPLALIEGFVDLDGNGVARLKMHEPSSHLDVELDDRGFVVRDRAGVTVLHRPVPAAWLKPAPSCRRGGRARFSFDGGGIDRAHGIAFAAISFIFDCAEPAIDRTWHVLSW